MKILHLFSDNRKTGPAEPAVHMASALQARGHEVLFAYRGGGRDDRMDKLVKKYGVPATTDFALNRYMGIWDTIKDLTRLPNFIRREKFDIIHGHLQHDYWLGTNGARRSGKGRPMVVQTLHRRDVLKKSWWYKFLLRNQSDGLLAFTETYREKFIERFDLNPERIGLQGMPVDLEQFNPANDYQPMREKIGVPEGVVSIGIVGRFQTYRKMGLFLEAAARTVKQRKNVRFVIIGRSRSVEETVRKPIQELGLEEYAIHAGYFFDDYPDAIASLDVFSLLMPGSDGTARAVREAMALGKPCVVSNYGMLPEIVTHEQSGLVVPLDPDELAAAWVKLIDDTALREKMGLAARAEAEARFDMGQCAEEVEAFYEKIIGMGGV